MLTEALPPAFAFCLSILRSSRAVSISCNGVKFLNGSKCSKVQRVQRFNGSRFKMFKGSMVQGSNGSMFKGSMVQRFKGSMFKGSMLNYSYA
jgi:hypothetical protein